MQSCDFDTWQLSWARARGAHGVMDCQGAGEGLFAARILSILTPGKFKISCSTPPASKIRLDSYANFGRRVLSRVQTWARANLAGASARCGASFKMTAYLCRHFVSV